MRVIFVFGWIMITICVGINKPYGWVIWSCATVIILLNAFS